VNPFHGTVFRISDTEVLVHPVRADLKMYEVVVSGFDVDPDFDEDKTGVFKRAGRRIGRAKDAVDCESGSFVFVAMRKRPNNTDSRPRAEDSYYYIDPAPYLKKRFPKPGQHSTCNGFSYYYIGMAAEDGDMTGDAEDDKEDIHRHARLLGKLPVYVKLYFNSQLHTGTEVVSVFVLFSNLSNILR
jgi:hypothetical protein